MARKPKKKGPKADRALVSDEEIAAEERLARITALKAIEGMPSGDQVVFLRSCGFSVQVTATLLRISENQVSVSMHQAGNKKPAYLMAKKNGAD